MATNNFSASVSLNTGQSNRSIGNLTKGVNDLSKALEQLDQNIKKSNGSLESVAASVNTSTDAMQKAVAASKELQAQREAEAGAAEKAAGAEKKYADSHTQASKAVEQSATATGKAGAEAGNAAKGTREFSGAQAEVVQNTRAAKDGTDQYSESLASHRYLMYDVGATYRTVATLLLGIPAATSAVAIAFEKDFAQVQRTTGLAGDAAHTYQRQLKDLATEIPSTFGELAEVSKIGGQMGLAQESLESFTDTVVRFVETSDGVNIDKASTAFGRLENMFNVTPTGELADPNFFKRIGSAISYTADNSVTTEQAIISMLEKTTASAKNAGLSIQETIAMSSAMASSGLQPFLSSGFIIRFFGNFQKAAAAGGDELKTLAGLLNMTADEFQNVVRNDPYEMLHRVVTQMKDMDSVEGQQFLSRLGINGVQDPKVLNALSENLHVLDGAMDNVNESYANADYLDQASEGIFNTTAANIQKMINSFMNLGSTISSSNLPIFNQFITATTELVSTVDNLIDRSAAARVIVGGLLAVMAAAGVVAAFRSGLAFVNASLVMFRDAAQKGALAGGRFGGMNRQMAEIMLYTKGATDQQVASLLKGRSATEAYRIAIMTKRNEVGRDTAATQANTGAIAANSAAKSRAAGATSAQTAATVAAASATDRHTASMSRGAAIARGFRGTMGAIGGTLSGLLNPAFLIPGAVIAIGTSFLNSKSDADQFNSSIAEIIPTLNEFDNAYDQIINKMESREFGFGDSFLRGEVGFHNIGKTLLEIADGAGVTEQQLRKAFEGGEEGLRQFAGELRTVADQLREEDMWGNLGQTTDMNDFAIALDNIADEMARSEEVAKRLGGVGAEVTDVVDGMGNEFEESADQANTFSQSLSDAVDTVFGMVNAEAGLTQALENMGKSLADSVDVSGATSESAANIQNYQRVVTSSMELMQQQLSEGTFASVQEASAYYTEFFQGLEQQLVNTGIHPEDAALMTQQAIEVMQMTLGAEGNELVADLDADPTNAYNTTFATVEDIQQYVEEYPFEMILDANGEPATENTWAVVNWIAEAMGITPEAVLDAIDGNATENTAAVWEYIMAIMHDDFVAELEADPTAGEYNVNSFYNWAMDRIENLSQNISLAGAELDHLNNTAAASGIGGVIGSAISSAASQMSRLVGGGGVSKMSGYRASRANLPAAPSLSASSKPSIPQPDFGALNRGYNNAAKAAGGAGNAAKKAGNAAKKAGDQGRKAGNQGAKGAGAAQKATDKAREASERAAEAARNWNKQWQDLQSWAGRVGEALSMAFDQKHAVQSARDEYYSVLNGINDRLKQQRDRIKDLRDETRRLTAERKVELNEASKFENMAAIAARHGNQDRAKDYRDQAKAMRERANEMSSTISANKAEQSTIQAGIGNLKGYSQAAIDNRQELRQLEQAALKVPQAYASIGASAASVANQTRIWTGRVQTHSRELGYTNTQVRNNTTATSNYIRELNRVPRNIPTVMRASTTGVPAANRTLNNAARARRSTIGARTGSVNPTNRTLNNVGRGRNARFAPYTSGVPSVDRTLNNVARNRTVRIGVLTAGLSAAQSTLKRMMGYNQGGQIPAFNSGGLIPGRSPRDPREDNLIANVDGKGHIAVRSQEYIIQEPAVKHYGLDYIDDINKMRLPKYNMGGSLGGASGSGSNVGVIDLSAKTINLLAKQLSQTTVLEADSQELARAVSRGQMENDQKRGVFRGV